MNETSIGFIGGGNMATALINGLIADGTPASNIIVAEPDALRREQLAASLQIRTREDNQGVAEIADILVLAVKPQVMQSVAVELAKQLQQTLPLVISIAAGIRHHDLQRWIGSKVPLVRAMPNTPAMVQSGATGLYASTGVVQDLRDDAERVMRAVGMTQWIEEETMMDAVTAISGSGPAYFFLFMEALEESAKALGLSARSAHMLTLQTALGAAKMALESELDVAELRSRVTSPGGTTEQAIAVFNRGGLKDLVTKAVTAAKERSEELSRELGNGN